MYMLVIWLCDIHIQTCIFILNRINRIELKKRGFRPVSEECQRRWTHFAWMWFFFPLAPPSRLTGSSSSLTSSSREHSRKEYCAYSISCNRAGMHCSELHALRFLYFLLCVIVFGLPYSSFHHHHHIKPVGIQHLYLISCNERLTSVLLRLSDTEGPVSNI